jgi:uncharacterized membrane protein (DUF4010 family)
VDPYEVTISLAMALAVGFLIGLQRQQSAAEQDDKPGHLLGGIRTFPLFALIGALSTVLSKQAGVWVIVVSLAAVVALLGIAYADDLRKNRDRGLTTEAAFILTFLLGVLSTSSGLIEPATHRLLLVAGLGVTVTVLLSAKEPLHRFAGKVSRDDIYATLRFAVVAVIILPLLPNRTMGPLEAFNPFKIGLMVVLIAGISFVGYVAVRVLGAGKGLGLTAALGGLASSTAVTLSFAGQSKRQPQVADALAMGVVLASTIMFGRVLVMISIVNPALLPMLAMPIGVVTVVGLLAIAYLYFRGRRERAPAEDVKLSNPFELGSAIKFGVIFALVLLATKAATKYFGAKGIYAAAVLAGTTDVDAITLSMANLAQSELTPAVAVTAIVLAAVSNTISKGVLAFVLGAPGFRGRVALAFGAMILAGLASIGYLWIAADS